MNNEKDESDSSRSRDTQVDLFTLIGGSWPPAPQPPEHRGYRSAPIPRRNTMHRSAQNERIKSVNLIEHMVPTRRNKQANVNHSEESKKMVYDQKKVETGILVDVCSNESPHGVHNSTVASPGASNVSRPSPNSRNQEGGMRGNNIDQTQYGDVRWNETRNNEAPEELYDSPALGSPRAVVATPTTPTEHIQLQDEIGVGSLVEVATDVDQHHYGVVRWIGIIDETATAGVELEQSVCGLGDGTRGGTRVFACAPGRALFVPLALCRRDARFRDTPPPRPPADTAADNTDRQWALYVHPVYVGDYPPIVKERVAAKSAAQGYPRSRLIEFTPDEVEYIRGTSDIFGLNHYSATYVYRNAFVFGAHESPSLYDDAEILTYQLAEWKIGESEFTKPDCPVVPGVVPPVSSLSDLAGKNRGIQGHHNSCYLDATLFAMFTFTSVFDALLYRPPEPEDSPHYSEVQRVLREEVVNPLRKHGYVRADRVMKLRTLLEKLSDVPGLTSEEKDPEEFLNGLVAQLLRAEPFLKLSSGQESYCYQLFVEKDEHVSLPTVQQLLEQSFATSGVKLSEVPSTLIIQMPRFGKQYKLYNQVLPSPLLDVTDLIEGLPRQCAVCGALARWECAACATPDGGVLEAGAFCRNCLRLVHQSRPHHKAIPLSVCEEYVTVMESCTLPRVYMELFAVLCIETSHYVAFVKAGTGIDAPWCFFDSMADRKGERNGYNIPEIVCIPELGSWLVEEGDPSRPRSLHARRLLADAYMCFYRSPDVAMYR